MKITKTLIKQALESYSTVWDDAAKQFIVNVIETIPGDDIIYRKDAIQAFQENTLLSKSDINIMCRIINCCPPALISTTYDERPVALSKEELLKNEGMPVWTRTSAGKSAWMIVYNGTCFDGKTILTNDMYGQTWLAFGFNM